MGPVSMGFFFTAKILRRTITVHATLYTVKHTIQNRDDNDGVDGHLPCPSIFLQTTRSLILL